MKNILFGGIIMNSTKYYARNEEERSFDREIRSKVYDCGTKSEMALYIQGQAILNLLRHIEDEIKNSK